VDSFKSWFNIDVSASSTSASNHIITKLHAILKPFLLRRVKREVEKGLPPKKEYLLSAPVTLQQKKLYDAVIKRQIRDFLLSKKELLPDSSKENGAVPFSEDDEDVPSGPSTPKGNGNGKKGKNALNGSSSKKRKALKDAEENSSASAKKAKTNGSTPASQKRARPNYAPVSNEEFLDSLDDGSARDAAEAFEQKRFGHLYASAGDAADGSDSEAAANGLGKEAVKKISGLKLSNMVMQLRKVVNHVGLRPRVCDPRWLM
jgi:ATP-dependent DNA helicase